MGSPAVNKNGATARWFTGSVVQIRLGWAGGIDDEMGCDTGSRCADGVNWWLGATATTTSGLRAAARLDCDVDGREIDAAEQIDGDEAQRRPWVAEVGASMKRDVEIGREGHAMAGLGLDDGDGRGQGSWRRGSGRTAWLGQQRREEREHGLGAAKAASAEERRRWPGTWQNRRQRVRHGFFEVGAA